MAATHRAVYQVYEHGLLFSDPLAVGILGVDQNETDGQARETPASRRMRLFISIRTRFAEDSLALAYQKGVRQLLVIGAGLDNYGNRRTLPEGLRVFEVDRRKVERLSPVDPQRPRAVTYVAADFENENCGQRLAAAGFNRNERTLVTWLGLVPYLTEGAIWATLRFLSRLTGGVEVVFDYSNPPHTLAPERHRSDEQRAATAASDAANEEHSLSHFDTTELHERLRDLGFLQVNDLGPVEIVQRYLPDVTAPVTGTGGRIAHIATV
jgi:methyltransferase (TIGR00027 family)